MAKTYRFTIDTDDETVDQFMTSTQQLLQTKWNTRLDEE